MAAPNSYFASAPVVLQQNPSGHLFTGEYYAETPNQPGQYYDGTSSVAQTPGSTFNGSIGSIPPTPGSLAGRKRSRADIFAEDEDDDMLVDGSINTPLEGPNGGWGESQSTRTPFELGHIKRPSVSSRKSMRKDASATVPDDLAHLLLPPQIREAAAEPHIDEATRLLGISWTRMDSTEGLRIAKAAYSKWIEAHYPGLKDIAVWFENSALPGYLVEARNVYSGQQAFYIFSNDLTEARLVTTEPAQLLPRLRLLPALHLAAPGGHIRAEMDPITAAQNEVNTLQTDGMSKFSHEVGELRGQVQSDTGGQPAETNGLCSAHAMELD